MSDNTLGIQIVSQDITERKNNEQALHAEKEQLRITLKSIGDGVITTDDEGRITLINAMAENLTGWTKADAIGKPSSLVFNICDETGAVSENTITQALQANSTAPIEDNAVLISKDGSKRYITEKASLIKDIDEHILGAVLVFSDVTDKKTKEEKIVYLNYHDHLTGVYNRTFFEIESNRLDTSEQLPLSVIIGDINGLKQINDEFGHIEGNRLLFEVARILTSCCRKEDILARIGGDEFCILLPNTSYEIAQTIIKRIKKKCEDRERKTDKDRYSTSISFGLETKTNDSESFTDIFKAAEGSMYRQKLLELDSLRSSILSSIKATMFEKSRETEEHAQRMVELSKHMGKALNLSDNQHSELELLSSLHDIGKISIDTQILYKCDDLSEAEWIEVKKHPEVGYRIAQATEELRPIANYILCHHERWDGNGYPNGLACEEIPLLSRIIALIDAYDAMTQDRPYGKAMSKIEAIQEIENNAGTQFDPEIARVFVETISNQQYEERSNVS